MYEVPTSLSPSRVEAFTSCPLAFRFNSIQRLPEPPSPHATKGSLVHRALELLFTLPRADRTPLAARPAFELAVAEFRTDPEFTGLGLAAEAEAEFLADAWSLVEAYFAMEDPTAVHDVGLELRLEAQVGELTLRGIIDRLELDRDGRLVVTDYKTGRSPGQQWAQRSLGGVHFYSLLCEQVLGQRPAAIRLLYLRSGEVLTATPTEQSTRFVQRRTTAVWQAVQRACVTGDFRPNRSALCATCAYRPWCPVYGGDPERAAAEAPLRFGTLTAA